MERVTDEELLARAHHDAAAFAEFYRRHAAALLSYTTSRLGKAELGADATAESFACALEGLRRYDPERGSPVAWLYGIALHQVMRAQARGRVENRYRARLGIPDLRLAPDEIARIEERVRSEHLGEDLERSMLGLPVEQREALRARVIEELPYDEIARRADASPAAVRQRVSRALTTLRSKLGENG